MDHLLGGDHEEMAPQAARFDIFGPTAGWQVSWAGHSPLVNPTPLPNILLQRMMLSIHHVL